MTGTEEGKSNKRGTLRPILVTLLLLLVMWAALGCDKHARYRVLSLLFDGVPKPDEPQEKKAPVAVAMAVSERPKNTEASTPSATRYIHPPAEGTDDCSFCHGAASRMVSPPKDICLRCHTHVHEKLRFIHRPAVVDCVACHNPHESFTKMLLKTSPPSLCFPCHDRATIEATKAHAGQGEVDCLGCHDPHGGKDRFFLK